MMTRRNFLQTSSAVLAGSAILGTGKLAASPFGLPIGLQLYSVRDACGKDLPGTLDAVAKMGYPAVEFAGYYGHKAPELRKMLDEYEEDKR